MNAVYRDNALQWLLRNIRLDKFEGEYCHSLANFDIEDFGDFCVPLNLKVGNLEQQLKNANDQNKVKLKDLIPKRKITQDESLEKLVRVLPRSKIGLMGVYHFVSKNWQQIFNPEHIKHHRHDRQSDFQSGIFSLGLIASHHTVRDVVNRANELKSQFPSYFEQGLFFIRELWS